MKLKIADIDILMSEWNYEKNAGLGFDPKKLSVNSHEKVWWICSCGHEWESSIANRYRLNRNCPYCAHQITIKGENDLQTVCPELAQEWHPTKNGKQPSEVFPGSNYKAWWICPKGHEYQAIVKSRNNGTGCPICAGKKVLVGFNDLLTNNPTVASEWNYEKNGDLRPTDVTFSSGKKVWWKCKNNHEWLSTVDNRRRGNGCPKCSISFRTSFPEQAVFYYIKSAFPDAISGYRGIFESSMELDVFIPSINVGIEYDGAVYHSADNNRLRDARKYSICKEHNVKLIRVSEMKKYVPIIDCDHKIEIPSADDKHLNYAISNLCYHLGKIVDVNIKRDRKQILSYLSKRQVSLAEEYPDIAGEWDYDENEGLLPTQFPPHSNENVWWKCASCGYKWKASIGDRTRKKSTGCPKCSSYAASKKRIENIVNNNGCFLDKRPQLIEEWDFENNEDINPYALTPASSKKVWWKCKKCGYNWKTDIGHRVQGRGCPCCANKVIITGINDFATTRQDLLKEWDLENNKDINPFKTAPGSGKKAWWVCSECGYKWQASVVSRTKGSGCPACFNERRKHGLNRKK